MDIEHNEDFLQSSDYSKNVELMRRRMADLEEMILTSKEYEQKSKFLEYVLDNVQDGLIATDLTDSITLWNEACERIYGWKSEDVIGKRLDEVIPIDVYGLTLDDLRMILLSEGHWHGEAIHLDKNGNEKKIDWSVSILKNKRGVDMGTVSINRDITEKKRVEKMLKETEQKFRKLVGSIPSIAVQGYTQDREVIYWNMASEKLYGYTINEAMGSKIEDLIIPKDMVEKVNNDFAIWCKDGITTPPGEFGYKRKDGKIVPVHSSKVMLRNSKNEVEIYQIDVDLTEIKLAEEVIRKERDKARLYFDIAGAILLVLDPKGNIVILNQKGCKVLGYWEHEVVGKNWVEMFIPVDQKSKISDLMGKIKTGEVTTSEKVVNEVMTRSGERRIIAWHNTVLLDDNNKVTGFLSSGEDITEMKKTEQQLRVAKDKAERSDRLKSEFLAQMSHEIRTPINSILSFTNFIEEELEGNSNEDLHMGFDIIKIAGKRLIRTIDLILNMSEIQAGTYDYVPKVIDFYHEICLKLYNEFEQQAKTKNLKFKMLANCADTKVYADEYTIIQIFNNLLDNAVKYTMEGAITITLERAADNDLIVKVEDTGIGISDEYLPNLFNAFSQEDEGYSRKFEGNGLGLALVKKYCELNKAKIYVKSEKNKGSVFAVKFPYWETLKKQK